MIKCHVVFHSVNDNAEPCVQIQYKEFPGSIEHQVMSNVRDHGIHWKDGDTIRSVPFHQIIELRFFK